MATDYVGNSHKSKMAVAETQQPSTPVVKKAEIKGGVKIQKKSGFQKFIGTFIAEDATNVKDYLVNDVLIPNAKAAISDVVSNGVNMILYGDAAPRRTSTSSGGQRVQKIQYGGIVNSSSKQIQHRRTVKHDFDFENIVFSNRGDAEIILNNLTDALESYGVVTVADLYDAVSIETHNYMLNNYGWDDLSSSAVRRVPDGYILLLPDPKPLDK